MNPRFIPVIATTLALSLNAAATDSRPARTDDLDTPEILQLRVGPAETPLAPHRFTLSQDRLLQADGTVTEHYYRDQLGVRYYAPIDKRAYPTAPMGWASWYGHYHQFDATETRRNARWLAQYLKPYGLQICQIDDAFQGKGRGDRDNRDFFAINERFGDMRQLADEIRELGLRPGLWIVPQGQSNPERVRANGGFMVDASGKSLVDEWWVGDYLLDPTKPEAHDYLRQLFETVHRDWGYEFFKIDGQTLVIDYYKKHRDKFADPTVDPMEAYRAGLDTIRRTVGDATFLMGCWGTPFEGIGKFNGSRTAFDVWGSWRGFYSNLEALRNGYHLHNTVWYGDPDVVMVGDPLSLDQARFWASSVGVTGQITFVSERMPELAPGRVEVLRRIFPTLDVEPLDLFPQPALKETWNLRVAHLGRTWNVVVAGNTHDELTSTVRLDWASLGLKGERRYHIFDFWNREYLGCYDTGWIFRLPPGACRVFAIHEAQDTPVLVSTSRHLGQGVPELTAATYDAATRIWKGRSRGVAGDRYELRFAHLAEGGVAWRVARAEIGGQPVSLEEMRGCSFVSAPVVADGEIDWEVAFEAAQPWPQGMFPGEFAALAPQFAQLGRVRLELSERYGTAHAYRVEIGGRSLGYTRDTTFELEYAAAEVGQEYTFTQIWADGSTGKTARVSLQPTAFPEASLADAGHGSRVARGERLKLHHKEGMSGPWVEGRQESATLARNGDSDLRFPLAGAYAKFRFRPCLHWGAATLSVWADGREIWSAAGGQLKAAPEVELPVAGVRELTLRTRRVTGQSAAFEALWISPRVRE